MNRSPGFLKLLKSHLLRRGVSAEVESGSEVRIHPAVGERPRISVVTCFRDRSDWTIQCLEALERQQGVDFDVILIDNQSSPDERVRVDASVARFTHPVKIISHDGPFHFARMNNEAVRRHAKGQLLFFLNNDVFLSGPDVLLECARWALLPEMGTVGLRLVYPDGRVQHDGVRAEPGGGGRLVRVGHFPSGARLSQQTREVFANTFAACMVRREVFEAAGGLCELDWVNGFGDIAFQLECLRRGYRNLYLGHVGGVHVESGSRGSSYEYWEEMTLERKYPELVEQMVRADLAWHSVEGAVSRLRRTVLTAAADSLRANAPQFLDLSKKALNALRGRVKMT